MSDVQAAAPASSTHLGGDTPAPAPAPAASPAAAPAPAVAAPAADPAKPAADLKADPNAEPAKPDAKDGEDKDGDDKPAGAPEKYEEFTLPEGVKLDEPVMGKFTQIAKELNLSQEAAQKLVTLSAEMQAGNVEQLQAAIEAQGATWAKDAKVDKEFGGDKFDQNLAVARKALDEFGTPEFKTLLAQSKMGNHPEVLRFFYRAGKALSEDGFVPGRVGTNSGKTLAQQMYPNMNP